MPLRLNDDDIEEILSTHRSQSAPDAAKLKDNVYDVVIAGTGPVACAYARTILEQTDSTVTVLMVDIGSQDGPEFGSHNKNPIKYQKDLDAFVHVVQASLQPLSIPPEDTYIATLGGNAWRPDQNNANVNSAQNTQEVIHGRNPNQVPKLNLSASAASRTVGGMATHWTCACPTPHREERVNNPIAKVELDSLLSRARSILGVHSDQYDNSIRHSVVKTALLDALAKDGRNPRGIQSLPLAVKRQTDNPDFVTWSGADTVLGSEALRELQRGGRLKLWTETRVTRLIPHTPKNRRDRIGVLVARHLKTDRDVWVFAKAYVVACGAVGTPQILFNSDRVNKPEALGRYLTEQSLAFCQIVLRREIIETIPGISEFKEKLRKHREKHPSDPLPIPFNDPEPQMLIPYTSDFPYHIQIHRDAFSYGEIGRRADPRVVVDVRSFGRHDISEDNRVYFSTPLLRTSRDWVPGVTDTYGMPQPTVGTSPERMIEITDKADEKFDVKWSRDDERRDQRMMKDLTDIANILGGYLPGSEPQFMEPGVMQHITGTTRIGNDPKTSVADPSSRVHGYRNLWVGGNGCIPDSTACNPTLTSIAIALKGAEAVVKYLKEYKE